MSLQAFISRPIMATAVNLVLLVVGLVAFERLELRHTPNKAKNEFRIDTYYTGANSYAVEQRVTKPLEDALSGLEGLEKITSESGDGNSQIHVKFKPSIDHNRALSELRDRVLLTLSSLPENVKRPDITEEMESSRPIVYLAFEDKSRNIAELSDYLRRSVIDRLRLIDGVSNVDFWGNHEYEVSVSLDPARLMEYQITPVEVVTALKREKAFASGGELEKNSGKEQVVLEFAVKDPKDYADVTIKSVGAQRIKIGDVANVSIRDKPTFLHMRVNGQNSIGLRVSVKPEANPLQVAERTKKFVSQMQSSMPASMKVETTYDATLAFKDSLIELRYTLWEAILLVGVIITIALASFRAAILPMVTVPLCLVATFALMWVMGFSLNPVTLLALVLAVGLVVDDAIVVVENIHHHMETGATAFQAAVHSMKEITFAIIVMTITLAAVYLPVAFQADESAIMFREFACTLAGSVLISGFVALTLTPALCGRFLKRSQKSMLWESLMGRYRHWLGISLNHPKKICLLAVMIAIIGGYAFSKLGKELMPVEDENYIQGFINYENSVPENLRNSWFVEIEKILKTVPEHVKFFTYEWQQRWLGWSVVLTPRAERTRDIKSILEELQGKLKNVVGPMIFGMVGEEGGIGGNETLKVIIQYSGDYQRLIEAVKAIQADAKGFEEFERLSSEQTFEISRLQVEVDKPLAQELGVGMDSLEDTLYIFLSGRKATEFNFKGFDYDVNVRGGPEYRSEFSGINQYFVTGSQGQWIPLGSLVSLKEVLGASRLKHYDRIRGVSITAYLNSGVSLDKAMQAIEPIVKKHLPKDAHFKFGGSAEKYQQAQRSMWLTYALALIFIYLVLAALFESFIHPFVVLLTVPLSITGAVLAIHSMGGTNNVYTAIGLVTLVGLVTKHGIMIVDFSNRLRQQGIAIKEAVLEASTRRLRPILMTTLAMICGAVPLVYSIGAGAIARHHIGWVIIGGMFTGTLFSLFVVPVAYQLASKKEKLADLK